MEHVTKLITYNIRELHCLHLFTPVVSMVFVSYFF